MQRNSGETGLRFNPRREGLWDRTIRGVQNMTEGMNRRQALRLAATGALAAAAGAALVSPAQAEYQPMMQAALNSLNNARAQLMNATADKGGHRVMAINLIDQAIVQVQLGIAWDDTH
jgi:hypothetical protein